MAAKGTPYFAGLTKSALEKAVQAYLSKREYGEEFDWPSLSDLIAAKHYYCAEHGLRPQRFRKLRRPGGGYDFQGYFDGHGWHGVSWKQSIYPRRDEDWIVRALRDAITPVKLQYRAAHPVCERCGTAPSEDVHHARPTMKEIVAAALASVSEEQWRAEARRMNWWSPEPYQLSEDSPILERALELHQGAELQALCRRCHHAVECAGAG